MKKTSVLFLIGFLFATLQIQAQERFKDVVFDTVESETFTYTDTLQLDFYTSKQNQLTNKPLLILVHGGGFATGKRNNPLEKKFCEDMAKRGYAVVSMSYHLTRKGKSFGCDYASEGKIETFNSVTNDILEATNFLIQKSEALKINPNQIILVGSSAGAEAVLNTVYMPNTSKIKYAGVVSFAGAVTSLEYLTKDTAIPSIFFHGKKDNLVPYYIAPHHYCKPNQPGFLTLFGAKAITDKLEELGTSYLLATDPNGNHDWANIAYNYTNEIADFITKAILNKEQITANLQVSSKK